jgi:hypothetical protein
MHTTTDTSSGTAAPKGRGVFGVVFGALLLVGNLLVLAAAWQDGSWGALVMAVIVGPILNGVFLISGLVAIPFLKRHRQQFSLGLHLALTLGVPIAAVVADFFIIMSMGLHGC